MSLLAWLVSTCAHPYQPPRHDEPNALVQIRLMYRLWPGPLLEQVVSIDGDDLLDIPSPQPQGAGGAAHRSIRVRPGSVGCSVRATFFHNDVSSHAETYETSEAAPCGSSTCRQARPHTRLVSRVERVEDATCTQGLRLPAKRGERYFLEYEFLADQECSLRCYRQGRQTKGRPSRRPCDESDRNQR
jgi:hypothetical protein